MSEPTSFQFRNAPEALRPYVVGFAQRTDLSLTGRALELPLLYPLLQVFVRGDYWIESEGGQSAPRAAVWGASEHIARCRHDEPLCVFVAILATRGLASLLRVMPAALLNRRAPLFEVDASRRIERDLIEAQTFDERIAIAVSWLSLRCTPPMSPLLEIADAIAEGTLRGSVSDIAAQCKLSERSLQRGFARDVGWTAKWGLRVARLQRAMNAFNPSPWRHVDDHALLEFSDDAHLGHEFVALTSLTPGLYRRRKAASGDRLLNTVYVAAGARSQPCAAPSTSPP
ncbi:MAG: helix-turn-helix domain-containing protein [Vitreimonas sp.]